MHWTYLLISGLFEIAWMLSLKYTEGFTKLVPTICYAATGLCAAFFLSLALKTIPMATAYAIWMGIAIVGSVLIDIVYFGEPYNWVRLACILLIIAGIGGLHATSDKEKKTLGTSDTTEVSQPTTS